MKSKYFTITCEQDLKSAAIKNVPVLYRMLKLSYSKKKFIDFHPHSKCVEWLERQKKESKIWPFCFNQNTLAIRKGFLAVEHGIVVDYIVTEKS